MLIIYGSALLALGCWATFTTSKTLTSRDWLPGLAMLSGMFEPWTLTPLGVCYVALIPFPCYFRWANHGSIRTGRNVLFLLVGLGLIAAGLELLPVSWFGL